MLRIVPDSGQADRGIGGVVGVHLRPNGEVVVASQAARALLFFSGRGRFLRALGRTGPGPGEFDQAPWMLFGYRDTLVVVDNSGKAQVFSGNGAFVHQLPRPRSPSELFAEIAGVFDDGSVIVAAYAASSSTAGDSTLMERIVWRQSPHSDSLVRLLRFPGYYRKRIEGRFVSVRFDPTAALAVGGLVACAGYSARYDLSCVDASGRPVMTVRRTVPRRRITEADREYLRRDHLASNPRASPKRLEQDLAGMRVADRAPAFGTVRIATSGEIWVSDFDASTSQRGAGPLLAPSTPLRWDVYSKRGDWLAQIWLPARFYPWEFGDDYVAGVAFDDDDQERIEVHRLQRSSTRR